MENSSQKIKLTVVEATNLSKDLMKNSGKSKEETIDHLVNEGFNEEVATNIVNNSLNIVTYKKEDDSDTKSQALKDILFGALWFVGGSVVTIFTYSNAYGGGRYVVAYGAIIFGAIQLIRGLYNYSSHQ